MYDVIIVGGGIVGLATAYQLKEKNEDLRVVLLEKENSLAKHQTGNNSGVIHSGIYYKPGSLKAQNCLRGYAMLLEFAQKHNIPYDLCGKLIVATAPNELQSLENIYQRGLKNGLNHIKKVPKEAIKDYEPYVQGIAGIHLPYTGIIDYTQVCLKLAELFKAKGGEIRYESKVTGLHENSDFILAHTENGEIIGKTLVNCAGLYSDIITSYTQEHEELRIIPFRGEYYLLKPEKHHLVKALIYPVPDPNFPFLGVHFTRMIHGGVEAGPNAVFAFKKEGYHRTDVDFKELWHSLSWPGFRKVALKYWKTGLGEYYRSFSKAAFTKALQRLVPKIQQSDLLPTHAGVRAQACERNGGLLDDFKIVETKHCVHVCNAPSPAATSSLSIGDTVADIVLKRV